MSEKKPNKVFFCSTLAGVICNSLMNPLDVIKVRLQNDAKKCYCPVCCHRASPLVKANSICNTSVFKLVKSRNIYSDFRLECDCLPFRTNIKALIYLARKEGFRTLGNGLTQGVLASTISAVTFITFYEAIRKKVAQRTKDPVLIPLLSAFFARGATTTMIFPFEYWRTVQQSAIGANRASVFKIGKSFNAGFTSLLARDIVFACINWVLIENIRSRIKHFLNVDDYQITNNSYQNKQTLLLSNFLAGGLAGGIASYISIPFDVVKTRKQLHPKEYKNKPIIQMLSEIYEKEGRRGLFMGARQRGWKVTFQTAGIITLYELFMDLLREPQLERV